MNARQRMVVIAMDLLLLAQLACSIYLGRQYADDMVIVFLMAYLPMVAVTLVAARVGIKILRTREQAGLADNKG